MGCERINLGLATSLIHYEIEDKWIWLGATATPMHKKDGSEEIVHTSNPL
jgi:hypothetical protein